MRDDKQIDIQAEKKTRNNVSSIDYETLYNALIIQKELITFQQGEKCNDIVV